MKKSSLKDMQRIFRKLDKVKVGEPALILVHPDALTVEDFKLLPPGYQVKLMDEFGQLVEVIMEK